MVISLTIWVEEETKGIREMTENMRVAGFEKAKRIQKVRMCGQRTGDGESKSGREESKPSEIKTEDTLDEWMK